MASKFLRAVAQQEATPNATACGGGQGQTPTLQVTGSGAPLRHPDVLQRLGGLQETTKQPNVAVLGIQTTAGADDKWPAKNIGSRPKQAPWPRCCQPPCGSARLGGDGCLQVAQLEQDQRENGARTDGGAGRASVCAP
ncbi:hypothetical protein GGTG_08019 [Gaeumannomyces tritici R3-111a-1]|uniref:Uncharacterized protein n=1 Tax=Gaeumannomyces tritici (strain R3-111a-1) TaxID=644352 RepID=J3P3D2_GAET3|nr:hypothetical protein GGTG_08019 [Gaeumannomyces tritici R3-111a-1]EJT74174.1 hypothetical protein GGTG_08019 [Gaeumannomyces tritici R3-111a-1]